VAEHLLDVAHARIQKPLPEVLQPDLDILFLYASSQRDHFSLMRSTAYTRCAQT